MATSSTFHASSPHAARYSVLSDTLDETVVLTGTLVIADIAAGPLREALVQADESGDAAWTALANTNMSISINGASGATLAAGGSVTTTAVSFAIVGGFRSVVFKTTKTGTVAGLAEIRFNHSMVR